MQVTEQTEEGVIALCVKKVAGHDVADDTEWVVHPPSERALCLPKEPFAPSWIILEGILGSTDFDF